MPYPAWLHCDHRHAKPFSGEFSEVPLIHKSLLAAGTASGALPEAMPSSQVYYLADLGSTLEPGAQVQIVLPDQRQAASVLAATARRLAAMASGAGHGKRGRVFGRVIEANFERRTRKILPDGSQEPVAISNFHGYDESLIREAFEKRTSMRLLVKGPGRFGPDGRLEEIETAEFTKDVPDGMELNSRDLGNVFAEFAKGVSDAEWKMLPADFSARHDYYIYGEGFKKLDR